MEALKLFYFLGVFFFSLFFYLLGVWEQIQQFWFCCAAVLRFRLNIGVKETQLAFFEPTDPDIGALNLLVRLRQAHVPLIGMRWEWKGDLLHLDGKERFTIGGDLASTLLGSPNPLVPIFAAPAKKEILAHLVSLPEKGTILSAATVISKQFNKLALARPTRRGPV